MLEVSRGAKRAMSNSGIDSLRSKLTEQVRSLGASDELVSHLLRVGDVSIQLANIISINGHSIDMHDVLAGALLHDIGYVRSKGIRHGIVGAEIARELGYSERVARI